MRRWKADTYSSTASGLLPFRLASSSSPPLSSTATRPSTSGAYATATKGPGQPAHWRSREGSRSNDTWVTREMSAPSSAAAAGALPTACPLAAPSCRCGPSLAPAPAGTAASCCRWRRRCCSAGCWGCAVTGPSSASVCSRGISSPGAAAWQRLLGLAARAMKGGVLLPDPGSRSRHCCWFCRRWATMSACRAG